MDRLNLHLKTYGCKVNTYDSGLLQARFKAKGFQVSAEADSKIHVLNSCAVTQEATKEVLRAARRVKREHPDARVVVTGCSAQVDREILAEESAIDLIVANSHKGQLEDLLVQLLAGENVARVQHSNIFKKEDLEPGGGLEDGHTRSFLKIQDGCNSFCTFCVIPFARGKSRSLAPQGLVTRIHELERGGVNEVVLTGVHIGDYEGPNGEQLEDLLEILLAQTKVPRLRLSSLEPPEVSPRLLGLYQRESRLCRHFHMSIQSANTRVLRAMKRNYGAEEVTGALQAIGESLPGSFVGMDVIAGFPGESDTEAEESWALLAQLPWTRLHVFPYSQRPGTFAARMVEQVPAAMIRQRAARLRELSDERLGLAAGAQVGQIKQVLPLKNPASRGSGEARIRHGLTRDYWPVQWESPAVPPDVEIELLIRGFDPKSGTLFA